MIILGALEVLSTVHGIYLRFTYLLIYVSLACSLYFVCTLKKNAAKHSVVLLF